MVVWRLRRPDCSDTLYFYVSYTRMQLGGACVTRIRLVYGFHPGMSEKAHILLGNHFHMCRASMGERIRYRQDNRI